MSEGMKLDVAKDNTIDASDLEGEFKRIAPLLYRWYEAKAKAEYEHDTAKAAHEQARSNEYIMLRTGQKEAPGVSNSKLTEGYIKSLIDTSVDVMQARDNELKAKQNLENIKGYVESLRAKKDMLIQLGSDRRKEL